ncbi:MAG: transglycosylase SLT domain-containing protein [Pseudomonadota bacterium]|nr:transglycosylase SLT domain-containing protein [Pseudomonadota bacterium]
MAECTTSTGSQAYQESQLDQTARSSAGAVGIMQLLPSTAASHPINIYNIEELENNIHAGAKYMHHLRTSYFDIAVVPPADQINFAWVAYNAGLPGSESCARLLRNEDSTRTGGSAMCR